MPVNWRKTILGLALLAMWLFTTLHCPLERAGIFKADGCCSESSSSESSSSESDSKGCSNEVCCNWVSPAKNFDGRITAAVPVVSVLANVPPLEVITDLPAFRFPLTAAPPDLESSWHFQQRAVFPARAPSFPS